jgi:lactate dehydrogenase-like 2-hydroxyacid dehydrogenase
VHHGFGATVIFHDYAEIPLTVSELIPARPVALEELMTTADIVSLSLPLNAKSNKMIGRDQLALMKRQRRSVNVGRVKSWMRPR